MRGYQRLRILEALTGLKAGNYDVKYVYDEHGRIEQELITGAINRNTVFSYNEMDNIESETITEGDVTITKSYVYDPETNNITDIHVVTL